MSEVKYKHMSKLNTHGNILVLDIYFLKASKIFYNLYYNAIS